MNITIRRARPDDALDMAEILSRSWEAAYKNIISDEYIKEKNATRPDLFRRIITGENTGHYIIQKDGVSVGLMCVAPPQDKKSEIFNDGGIDESFYELHGLYLHPDYYRQGIGSVAMKFALEMARSAGKSNIFLWVFAENYGSIMFYEKCGFTVDGAYKFINCGKAMKCVRMKRVL